MKRLYRRTRVGTLGDTAEVVTHSAVFNITKLVSIEDGTIVVPTMIFFCHTEKYHHFYFDSSRPGIVTMKENISLLKHNWVSESAGVPVPSLCPLNVNVIMVPLRHGMGIGTEK